MRQSFLAATLVLLACAGSAAHAQERDRHHEHAEPAPAHGPDAGHRWTRPGPAWSGVHARG